MELGMIGLGRMGGNMTERLVQAGHRVVVYDPDESAVQRAAARGGAAVDSLESLVSALNAPRVVWLMAPAGDPVENTIKMLSRLLSTGDIIIDGGNSNYKDSIRRAKELEGRQIHFVDVGTSGGVRGLKNGYCLMIGGNESVVHQLRPIFEALAPGADRGWALVGPAGAGHFVKMVHNGIEYGLMQAYAEGFSLLRHKDAFQLDLGKIAELWMHGSVVRSWLLQLTAEALTENPELEGVQPQVSDSGEGRWTVTEAIELNVPAPIITLSLIQRLTSRDSEAFGNRILAIMRNKFGGHEATGK